MSSIKEVAHEAHVSTATVSHVINNTRFVSEEVRERVVRAIEKCRYYPNANARSLASGRSRLLGLVISDISNPFFPELVKSIESAAFEQGYDIQLSNTNYDTERTSRYVRRFIERKVAGVAIMTSEMDMKLVEELSQREVPVVFLDVGQPAMHMSNLRVDYDDGVEQAVLHLASLGHRRIAYIGGTEKMRSAKRRLQAYRRIMSELFPNEREMIFYGDFKVEGGRRAASEILALATSKRPTAVMTVNDLTAIGAMREFQSAGLNIPADLSIVGFDDILFSALTRPSLTTVHLPLDELGRQAVDVLISSFEDIRKEGVEIRIPTKLVVRDSTASVPVEIVGKDKGKSQRLEKHTV
jgi:DNA-binding LacI/PurR family transcriptional regulator